MTVIEELKKEANILEENGDFKSSLDKYIELEKVSLELEDKENLLFSKRNQAWVIAHKLGDPQKGFNLYVEVEKLSREYDDKRGLMVSLQNQGMLLLENSTDYNTALNRFVEMEALSLELSDVKYQVQSLILQAACFEFLGEAKQALAKSEDALKFCKSQNDKLLIASILESHAEILESNKRYKEALVCYQEAEQIIRELGDKEYLLTNLASIARLYYTPLNDEVSAIRVYRKVEVLAKEFNNKKYLEESLRNQALFLIYNTTYSDAKEGLKKAKELHSVAVEMEDEIWARSNYIEGAAHMLLEEWKSAEICFFACEGICQNIGNKKLLSDCYKQLALICRNDGSGRYTEALEKYQEAGKIAIELNDVRRNLYCLIYEADTLSVNLGKYETALSVYGECEVLMKEFGIEHTDAWPLNGYATLLFEKSGDYEAAFAKFQEAETLARKLGDNEALKISLENQIIILKSWGDRKTARIKKEELKSIG